MLVTFTPLRSVHCRNDRSQTFGPPIGLTTQSFNARHQRFHPGLGTPLNDLNPATKQLDGPAPTQHGPHNFTLPSRQAAWRPNNACTSPGDTWPQTRATTTEQLDSKCSVPPSNLMRRSDSNCTQPPKQRDDRMPQEPLTKSTSCFNTTRAAVPLPSSLTQTPHVSTLPDQPPCSWPTAKQLDGRATQ